jgi:hypothetical protein
MTDRDHPPARRLTLLRRVVVGLVIVSFGIAAILGIIVLLGVELGETAFRVLATTAIVGAFSVAVLCCAALLGRRAQAVGAIGAVVSVVTAAMSIWTVWDPTLFDRGWETFLRLLWSGVAATAAFSLASLLLLLADRRRRAVRIGLLATLGLIALLLALSIWLAWGNDLGDGFARVYGIVAILTALGAVVVPVLSLLLRDDAPRPALSPELAERLRSEAARRGVTVDELVAPLLASPDADSAS